MDKVHNELKARISPNKFSPPSLDPSTILSRPRLFRDQLDKKGRHKKILIIEAQAGQGKTTLAAQFLQYFKKSFAWYQLGPEDGDPIVFLSSLLLGFMREVPGFRSPLMEEMLHKGEVSPLELPRFVDLFFDDLKPYLKGEFWLVLDDLHLLEGHDSSIAMLGHLLQKAPPRLRFALLTRRWAGLDLPVVIAGRDTMRTGNRELALTAAEIDVLYNDIMKIPVSGAVVLDLEKCTEGWTMGLVLAAFVRERAGEDSIRMNGKVELSDYFNEEVFTFLPTELRNGLLLLSLLEEIPVPLAEEITGIGEIGSRLSELNRRNFFVRSLNETDSMFRFHHLFRDHLRERHISEVSREDRHRVHRLAAAYYLGRDEVELALSHLLDLSDFAALDEVLARKGLSLVELNRIATLDSLLRQLPQEAVMEHPWIAYFSGIVCMEKSPQLARTFFDRARLLFSSRHDNEGELLTLAQLIQIHCSIDCKYDLGKELLLRADQLFVAVRASLGAQEAILAAIYISHGFCTIQVEPDKAKMYSDLALSLARQEDLLNLQAFARFNKGVHHAFFGEHRLMLEEIENALYLLQCPHVNNLNRMMLRILQLNALAVVGDFENFSMQERAFWQSTGGDLVLDTIAGPILLVNKIDIAIAEGDLTCAGESIEKGLSWGSAAASPHLRSQFLHYRALFLALSGKENEAMDVAAESRRLRQVAGGEIWSIVSDLIVGGTLTLADRIEEAENALGRAIQNAIQFGEGFLRSGALAHRAFLYLKKARFPDALEDVRGCLRCMQENGYLHFFSWTPQVMKPVLAAAVQHGIEVDYARRLAAERLDSVILEDGEIIPLLQIRTVGGLSIAVGGKVVLRVQDLTRGQRDLLAYLIAAPDQKRDQETLQHDLWPESSPLKARSNLDSLLLRLRKTLEEALAPHSSRHYLSLQKGIVCLENCRIDAVGFAQKARKGLQHYRREELWQAGNCFYSAHQSWSGAFLPGGPGSDEVRQYRDELERIYVESSLAWGKILEKTGRTEEAIQIVRQALANHITNDDLVRALYNLHIEDGSTVKARNVLKNYREALQREEFAPDEIEEIVQSVIFPPSA